MEATEKAFGRSFQIYVPSDMRSSAAQPHIWVTLPKPVCYLTAEQRNNVLKQLSAIRKYVKETT